MRKSIFGLVTLLLCSTLVLTSSGIPSEIGVAAAAPASALAGSVSTQQNMADVLVVTTPISMNAGKEVVMNELNERPGMIILFFALFAIIAVGAFVILLKEAKEKFSREGRDLWDGLFLAPKMALGLRKMPVFSFRPYRTFLAFFAIILEAFVAAAIVMLVVGFIIMGGLDIVGGLVWFLRFISLILLGIGIILFFITRDAICFTCLGLGILLTCLRGTFKDWYETLFEKASEMFHTFNPLNFCLDLVTAYWKPALIIAAAPIAIFLIVAFFWILTAWIVSLYEKIVMRKYNVKHPCPKCGLASEPAQYIVPAQNGGSPMLLPIPLTPGQYGIFHINVHDMGVEMPTLFLNGKDEYERLCPHCGTAIKADVGQEKHIALAGLPQSGKTSILYRMIAELQRNYGAAITDNMGTNHGDIVDFLDSIKDGGIMKEFPHKTEEKAHRSIQMILGHEGSAIPYKLYLNDLAGEMFQAEGTKTQDAPFFRNTGAIVFVVDPENDSFDDLMGALDALKNTLGHYRKAQDIRKIPFILTVSKADEDAFKDEPRDPESIKNMLIEKYELAAFIHNITTNFDDVSYKMVSAKVETDNETSGVDGLIATSLEKTGITDTTAAVVKEGVDYSGTIGMTKSLKPKSFHSNEVNEVTLIVFGVLLLLGIITGIIIGKRQNNPYTTATTTTTATTAKKAKKAKKAETATTVKTIEHKLTGKRNYDCNTIINNVSYPFKIKLDFDSDSGTSNWGAYDLSIKILDKKYNGNGSYTLSIEERNPTMTTIPNGALGSNISSLYVCTLDSSGSEISGNGKAWTGINFTFSGNSNDLTHYTGHFSSDRGESWAISVDMKKDLEGNVKSATYKNTSYATVIPLNVRSQSDNSLILESSTSGSSLILELKTNDGGHAYSGIAKDGNTSLNVSLIMKN